MQFTGMSGQQRKDEELNDKPRAGHHARWMRVLLSSSIWQHLALLLATANEALPPSSSAVVKIEKQRRVRLRQASQDVERVVEVNRDIDTLLWRRFTCVLCR
jgi:hypothetical protein